MGLTHPSSEDQTLKVENKVHIASSHGDNSKKHLNMTLEQASQIYDHSFLEGMMKMETLVFRKNNRTAYVLCVAFSTFLQAILNNFLPTQSEDWCQFIDEQYG